MDHENHMNDDGYIYNETYVEDDGDYEYYYEDPLISLFDVEKEYDNGSVRALNRVNLDIFEGEFVSIIGPSGSGKSTLLNMIGALDNPSNGEIYIDGINLQNLIPNLSVMDNVQIPLLHTGMSSKDMKKRANELISAVGLESKKKKKPNKLSGGERQRVAIARALVNNPSIILADEPTGSLDSKTGQMILDLLMEMHERYNVTLIIVTHDNDIANLAERTIQIKDGQIIEDRYNY